MSTLSTADYRELATEAQNHRDDEIATAALEADAMVETYASQHQDHYADRIWAAKQQAWRLDAVATLRELADAVEAGTVRGVAFAALGASEVASAYISIDGDHAGLLGAVTSLSSRIDREQLAPA